MLSISKYVIGLSIFAAVAFFVFSQLQITLLFSYFREINIFLSLAACLTILLSLVVSTFRFVILNQKFGAFDGWGFLHKVNMLSILYSMFALPVLMQIMARIQFGTQQSKMLYAPITIFEKSVSLALMFGFASFSSYFYFQSGVIKANFLYAFIIISLVIICTAGFALLALLSPSDRDKLQDCFLMIGKIGVPLVLLTSVLLQLLILASYVLFALQFVPEANIFALVASFSLVILATAIPLGFGGFGVREVTAGSVFIAFGLPAEAGITTGLLYSATHFLILVFNVLLSSYSKSKPQIDIVHPLTTRSKSLWFTVSFVVAILICFQIRVPLLTGIITINPADIVAIVIAINVIILLSVNKSFTVFWSNRLMWPGLAGFAIMIGIGWFIGWLNFGSNDWAFANRLLGMISVFSFLITGASLRHFLSNTQQKTILNTLLFSLVIGALFNLTFAFCIPKDIGVYFNWTNAMSGFVGDRNAFSFMGLIGITLALPTLFKDVSRPQEHHITIILIGAILALGIFSGSRTGWIGSFVIGLGLLFYFRHLFIQILKIFVISLTLLWAISEIYSFLDISNLSFLTGRNLSSLGHISDIRYKTWQTGFDLFLENPFWGAGLGAGIEKIDIVIHNLYLWVLGEMGMLGILLCLPLCFSILIGAFKDSVKNPYRHQQSMLLFLLVLGMFSVTHDIIYQRILWLAIGYFMASGCLLNRNEQT